MSTFFTMDGGGAGSNLSILKEAKKLYGPVNFSWGRGSFAYSYENLYIL